MSVSSYTEEIVKQVDKLMLDSLASGSSLYEAAKHTLLGGGKRLRPLILVSVSDSLGGKRESALHAGASVEMLHSFTLVHDDIMDQDHMRRGRPTVHVLWGTPMAILAGDLMHVKSYELMLRALKGKSAEVMSKVLSSLTNAVVVISEGQAMDMEFESRAEVTEEEYVKMISKKTAELFAVSAEIGGLLTNIDGQRISNLRDYGMNLGIAFQIADDILGLTADEKELGKPIYSDIREGKKTVLLIKALHSASEQQRKKILKALGNRNCSREELEDAAKIVLELSLDYATMLAANYSTKALQSLEMAGLSGGPPLLFLRELPNYVVRRRK